MPDVLGEQMAELPGLGLQVALVLDGSATRAILSYPLPKSFSPKGGTAGDG
jgi:hypothetical protein